MARIIPFSAIYDIVPANHAMVYCTCAQTNQDKYLAKVIEWSKYVCKNLDADFYVFIDGTVLSSNKDRLPEGITFVEILPNLGRMSQKVFPGWKRSFAAALLLARKYKYFAHIENDCFIKNITSFNDLLHKDNLVAVGWEQYYRFIESSAMIINNKDVREVLYNFYSDKKHQYASSVFEEEFISMLGNFEILGKATRLELNRRDNAGVDIVSQCTAGGFSALANGEELRPLFNHSGKIGDMLYSLNFSKEYANACGFKAFDLHLQTNKYDGSTMRLPVSTIKWLTPLLEYQPYINSISYDQKCPESAINLDDFRSCGINVNAGDIRYWYYKITPNALPKDFYSPILSAPKDDSYADRIIITRTARGRQPGVDYKKLSSLADKVLFIGTDQEYKDFCEHQFKCERKLVATALEAATVINSAKCFIGNQSGIFTIAEQLKVPRILECPEHAKGVYPNNLPFGGSCCSLYSSPTVGDVIEVTKE